MTDKETGAQKTTLPVLDDTLYWEMLANNQPPKRSEQTVNFETLIEELEGKGVVVSESLRRAALEEKLAGYREQSANSQFGVDPKDHI